MGGRPTYIDIDGTLTTAPHRPWGPVIESRLQRVRDMVAAGRSVVLWSGGGTGYAVRFADRYDLDGVIALGKPERCVDDNPDIRPRRRMPVIDPDTFFAEDEV